MDASRAYVIKEADLSSWVERLMERAQVIAPRAAQGGDVAYDEVARPQDIAWDYTTSLVPLKRFLFPQTDPMLRWRTAEARRPQLEPTYDERERIFFAVRPCDVSGVLFFDQVFGGDREDIYYLSRRQRSALVALSCAQPGANCFCVCADAGPFLERGFDLQMTRLADGYLVEVGSEKGAELVQAGGELFREASEQQLQERRELAQEAENRFAEDKAYFAAALRKVTFDRVPERLWQEMGERCLGCGGCTFVCPTCSCFTVADAQAGDAGERSRLWDSCLYETYTLEASGHNPRARRQHRVKARFFHKLSYQFARRNGVHGCVGCGRCVAVCLGGNDMPAVTAAIRRGELTAAPAKAGVS